MTHTVTGLVTDIVGPDDLDTYTWNSLNDFATRKNAWVALVRTDTPRTILGTFKEIVPFLDAGNHTALVVEEPHFGIGDIVAIDVYSPHDTRNWYAACDTDPIHPATSDHAQLEAPQ